MKWTKDEWLRKLQEVPQRTVEAKDWPVGIRPITLDEEGLGVDKEGNLYWHLKPVAMQVKLRRTELILAFLLTGAAITQAITSVITLLDSHG